jgi:hypothetical protein
METAPAASRANLTTRHDRYGKVLNIHGGMACSPAVTGRDHGS